MKNGSDHNKEGFPRTRVYTWDWSAQPDMYAVKAAVEEVAAGAVHMREVDSGGDFYVWVVSDRELDDAEAVEVANRA